MYISIWNTFGWYTHILVDVCCCCYMLIICFILWLNTICYMWGFSNFVCWIAHIAWSQCKRLLLLLLWLFWLNLQHDFMISWFLFYFFLHSLTSSLTNSLSLFILHFTSHLQYGFSDIGTLRCPNIVWIWKCTEIKANIAIVRNFIDMLLLYQDHHAESRLANEGKSTHVSIQHTTYNKNIIFILYL